MKKYLLGISNLRGTHNWSLTKISLSTYLKLIIIFFFYDICLGYGLGHIHTETSLPYYHKHKPEITTALKQHIKSGQV